ncbi:hypothetical protein LK09_09570 [Microbacterium mangrovi]|uniref:Uncharacterized protein n=1 Tax=Microbacterium mangrovi TaxID=1348253 RepID=A0A0B2A836_9MICO|nr:hypothetical protein LK09_09570 [Microbacterium mangrovi]
MHAANRGLSFVNIFDRVTVGVDSQQLLPLEKMKVAGSVDLSKDFACLRLIHLTPTVGFR